MTALSISREGDAAIIGCDNGMVHLFNLFDGEMTEQINNHRLAVTQVALSHSYLFSVSGSKDCTVKVYDNELGEVVTEFTVRTVFGSKRKTKHAVFPHFKEHSAPITHVRILEDNRKILSSDEQNYIKTWWANTGELIDSVGGMILP